MYAIIDAAKLADIQELADKLAQLPESALLYIAGYAEGRADAAREQKKEAS